MGNNSWKFIHIPHTPPRHGNFLYVLLKHECHSTVSNISSMLQLKSVELLAETCNAVNSLPNMETVL
jgi:hypothetical protein